MTTRLIITSLCGLLPILGGLAYAETGPNESLRPLARSKPAPVRSIEGRAQTSSDDSTTANAAQNVQDNVASTKESIVRETPLAELRPQSRDPGKVGALSRSLKAMRAEDWAQALSLAAQDGPVARDILQWHQFRSGRGTAAEVLAFLRRNADWPGLPYLKEKSEGLMEDASTGDVLTFFRGHTPRTGTGALALTRALRQNGEADRADAVIVLAWKTLALEPHEQAQFLARYKSLITPHHWARLDNALWQGWTSNPLRMEGLVTADQWALAKARMALRRGGRDSDAPAVFKDDAGLAYERFRKLKGKTKREFLLSRSTSAKALGRPGLWAPDRRPMARALMRQGALKTAYRVASTHFTTTGRDYADLEWLSGYLSLRMGKPTQALTHFQRFKADVFTPISLGRAGYWLGRTHEALGQAEAAWEAFDMAARYPTSFYGLLAAEKIGRTLPERLRGSTPDGDWRGADFTRSSVHQAAQLLLAAGEVSLAERFWTHLAEGQDAAGVALMGKMLEEKDQSHIQVMLGKRAARAGLEVVTPYYALHPVADRRWPVATELVLSIARRESEFDPVVVSHAGARGLMQLMPATARDVSGDLGIGYSGSRLLSDPSYNARLGSEYLRQMAVRYGGNPVLIAIAYNAGPARADRWQASFGNPRDRGVDIVDWIENIPFRETRNYVMRVTESLPVYRARLGQDPLPTSFTRLLKGSSLRP